MTQKNVQLHRIFEIRTISTKASEIHYVIIFAFSILGFSVVDVLVIEMRIRLVRISVHL